MTMELRSQIQEAIRHPLNQALNELLNREPPEDLVTLRSLFPVPVLLVAWLATESNAEKVAITDLMNRAPLMATNLAHEYLDESHVSSISLNDAAATILAALTEPVANEYTNLFKIYPLR